MKMNNSLIFFTALLLLKIGTYSGQTYQCSVVQNECRFEVLINEPDSSLTFNIVNLSQTKHLVFFEGGMEPLFCLVGGDTTLGFNNWDLWSQDVLYLTVIEPNKSHSITFHWKNLVRNKMPDIDAPDSVLYRYCTNIGGIFGFAHMNNPVYEKELNRMLIKTPSVYCEQENKIRFHFINQK